MAQLDERPDQDLYLSIPINGAQELRVLDLLPSLLQRSQLCGNLRAIPTGQPRLRNSTEVGALGTWFRPHPPLLPLRGAGESEISESYEALSYVWGRSSGDEINSGDNTILINRRFRLAVTKNLWLALRRLRRKLRRRTMWIDAICINQSDDVEKSHQVAMMGNVYRAARCVNVWLGESDTATSTHLAAFLSYPNDELAWLGFNLGKKTSRRIYHARQTWSSFMWRFFPRHPLSRETSTECTKPGDNWQDRAWTTQEFELAQSVFFCLGPARVKLPQDSLVRYRSIPSRLQPDHTHFAERLGLSLENLQSLEARLKSTKAIKLMGQQYCGVEEKLVYQRQSPGVVVRATDPRDLIYSLLGLITDKEARLIGCDYALTYEDVCARATYAALVQGDVQRYSSHPVLGMLRFVRFRDCRTPLMPAWAVDFRDIRGDTPDLGLLRFYEANLGPSGLNGYLSLKGRILGRVTSICRLSESLEEARSNVSHELDRVGFEEYHEYASIVSDACCQATLETNRSCLTTSIVLPGDLVVIPGVGSGHRSEIWRRDIEYPLLLRRYGEVYAFCGFGYASLRFCSSDVGRSRTFTLC